MRERNLRVIIKLVRDSHTFLYLPKFPQTILMVSQGLGTELTRPAKKRKPERVFLFCERERELLLFRVRFKKTFRSIVLTRQKVPSYIINKIHPRSLLPRT